MEITVPNELLPYSPIIFVGVTLFRSIMNGAYEKVKKFVPLVSVALGIAISLLAASAWPEGVYWGDKLLAGAMLGLAPVAANELLLRTAEGVKLKKVE